MGERAKALRKISLDDIDWTLRIEVTIRGRGDRFFTGQLRPDSLPRFALHHMPECSAQ